GPGRGLQPGPGAVAQGHPALVGQKRDLFEQRRGIDALGHPHLPGPAPARGQELAHGAPALHLLAAQVPPIRAAAGAGLAGSGWPGPVAPGTVPGGSGRAHRGWSWATAQQATPSPRPRAPRPSARVALTLTGAPSTAARLRSRSARWGARRGASSTTVQSTLAGRRPASLTMSTTRASRARLSASRQRSSLSGKCAPRSPRQAPPRRASATAWATTSASL